MDVRRDLIVYRCKRWCQAHGQHVRIVVSEHSPAGAPAREGDLNRAWRTAARVCEVPHAHMHDLRHFSGTAAAQVGATVRELQARLGHSTARAAMIYQHAAADRDRELAERMGGLLERASDTAIATRSGEVVRLGAHPVPIAGEAVGG